MTKDTFQMIQRLINRGIAESDAYALRRIAMTLHRWHELECGNDSGLIERDEITGKPFIIRYSYTGKRGSYPIQDRETGALKRLNNIMSHYPDLAAYVQGDPRGASLYIYRKNDPMLASSNYGIESCYSSIGCAVYK